MAYPLQTRNALYGLFLAFLDRPGPAQPFAPHEIETLSKRHPEFVSDRVPRYQRVIKQWKDLKKTGGFADDLRLGQALFNAGLFFDCHEYLESVWKRREGEAKTFLQGFIQLAAGMHKLEQSPHAFAGALYLVDHGLHKLEKTLPLIGAEPSALIPVIEIRNRVVAEDIDLDHLPHLHLV